MIIIPALASPDLITLANIVGFSTFMTLNTGARLFDLFGGNDTASGRRVQLPWGGGNFEFSELNANGETILRRSLAWAAGEGDEQSNLS